VTATVDSVIKLLTLTKENILKVFYMYRNRTANEGKENFILSTINGANCGFFHVIVNILLNLSYCQKLDILWIEFGLKFIFFALG
jgi:hypothetical protein